jgi:hypothetical protein
MQTGLEQVMLAMRALLNAHAVFKGYLRAR